MTTCPTCGVPLFDTTRVFENPHEKPEDCIRSLVRRVAALEASRPVLTFQQTTAPSTVVPLAPYRYP